MQKPSVVASHYSIVPQGYLDSRMVYLSLASSLNAGTAVNVLPARNKVYIYLLAGAPRVSTSARFSFPEQSLHCGGLLLL